MAIERVKFFWAYNVQDLEKELNDWLESNDVELLDTKYFITGNQHNCLLVFDPEPDLDDEDDYNDRKETRSPMPPQEPFSVSKFLKEKKAELEQLVYDRFQPAIADIQDVFVSIQTKTQTGRLCSQVNTIEVVFFYPNKINSKSKVFKATGTAATIEEAELQLMADFNTKAAKLLKDKDYYALLPGKPTAAEDCNNQQIADLLCKDNTNIYLN